MPPYESTRYVKQLISNLKKLTDNNTVTVGDFNTPLTAMERLSKQKTSKETIALNDTLDQTDLTSIFRIFYCKAEYTSFSNAHETFSRRDHIPGHK